MQSSLFSGNGLCKFSGHALPAGARKGLAALWHGPGMFTDAAHTAAGIEMEMLYDYAKACKDATRAVAGIEIKREVFYASYD